MKDYWKHVASYLTGWLIARATFERVWQHFMRDGENEARRVYMLDQAVAIADELESRRKSDRGRAYEPLPLDVDGVDVDEAAPDGFFVITRRTAQVVLHHVMGDSHLHSSAELDAAIKSLQIITGDT